MPPQAPALFDACDADDRRTSRDVQGNGGTSLVFAVHRYLEPMLTDVGRDQLRSQMEAAATRDFTAIFEVLESWVRSSAFECDPEISRRIEEAFALTPDPGDESFANVDELLAAIQ